MNILGISALYHDSAACLIETVSWWLPVQGRALLAPETRYRHSRSMRWPTVSMRAGLLAKRSIWMFYDKPITSSTRLLTTYGEVAPAGLSPFLKAVPVWLRDKAWVGYQIEAALAELGVRARRVQFAEHHLSLTPGASFPPSPFSEAAIIWSTASARTTTSIGVGGGPQDPLARRTAVPAFAWSCIPPSPTSPDSKVNSGEMQADGSGAIR